MRGFFKINSGPSPYRYLLGDFDMGYKTIDVITVLVSILMTIIRCDKLPFSAAGGLPTKRQSSCSHDKLLFSAAGGLPTKRQSSCSHDKLLFSRLRAGYQPNVRAAVPMINCCSRLRAGYQPSVRAAVPMINCCSRLRAGYQPSVRAAVPMINCCARLRAGYQPSVRAAVPMIKLPFSAAGGLPTKRQSSCSHSAVQSVHIGGDWSYRPFW
jgi:hypothetical protein